MVSWPKLHNVWDSAGARVQLYPGYSLYDNEKSTKFNRLCAVEFFYSLTVFAEKRQCIKKTPVENVTPLHVPQGEKTKILLVFRVVTANSNTRMFIIDLYSISTLLYNETDPNCTYLFGWMCWIESGIFSTRNNSLEAYKDYNYSGILWSWRASYRKEKASKMTGKSIR